MRMISNFLNSAENDPEKKNDVMALTRNWMIIIHDIGDGTNDNEQIQDQFSFLKKCLKMGFWIVIWSNRLPDSFNKKKVPQHKNFFRN